MVFHILYVRPIFGLSSDLTRNQKAVIKESLRLSSGVWTPMTRVVPQEGAQIGGHFVPGAVSLYNLYYPCKIDF